MPPAICPHCGYDIEPDKPVSTGGLVMHDNGRVEWQGRDIRFTSQEQEFLRALIKANGQPLSRYVIANRLGFEDVAVQTDVVLHRIRQKFVPDNPIETVWGRGWRWRVEA